jgi:hypothetical protein
MKQIYLQVWDKYSQAKRIILFFEWNLYLNCKGDGAYSLESNYIIALFTRHRLFSEFRQVAKSISL